MAPSCSLWRHCNGHWIFRRIHEKQNSWRQIWVKPFSREWLLFSLQWHHNEHDSVSNHQPHDCLLKGLFGRRSKVTSKLRVTGLCVGNSPVTGEFPAQKASNAENVSIWWRHHDISVKQFSPDWLLFLWNFIVIWFAIMNSCHGSPVSIAEQLLPGPLFDQR